MSKFFGLDALRYKIFDSSDSLLAHFYSPVSSQDEQEILNHFQAKKLALLSQEHSDAVHYVDDNYCKQVGDALVTDKPGVVIGVQTADCVCALLASSDQKVIGALHLGWRGAASNLLDNTIKMMREFSDSEIMAFISPCIRQDSYEVDLSFFDNFTSIKPHSSDFFKRDFEKLYFDLPGFVKGDLRRNGVINIIDEHHNTYASNKFFSFRFSKQQGLEDRRRILSCLSIA
jgi:hypothetical protein